MQHITITSSGNNRRYISPGLSPLWGEVVQN